METGTKEWFDGLVRNTVSTKSQNIIKLTLNPISYRTFFWRENLLTLCSSPGMMDENTYPGNQNQKGRELHCSNGPYQSLTILDPDANQI